MVTIIMQNRHTGDYNFTQAEDATKAREYFDKYYVRNWKVVTAIEGKTIGIY